MSPRPSADDVEILGWDERHAVALVKGVKVRVGQTHVGIRWSCAVHGTRRRPHCPHLHALAATPSDPEKRRGPSVAVNDHTTDTNKGSNS